MTPFKKPWLFYNSSIPVSLYIFNIFWSCVCTRNVFSWAYKGGMNLAANKYPEVTKKNGTAKRTKTS